MTKLSKLAIGFYLLFSLPSLLFANGIAVQKQHSHHADSSAVPFVYSSYRDMGKTYVFIINGKPVTILKSNNIFLLNLPKSFPLTVTTRDELLRVELYYKAVVKFMKRFPKSAPYLQANKDALKKFIDNYYAGNVRYKGNWMARSIYQSMLDKKQAEKLAKQKAAEERRKKKQAELLAQKKAAEERRKKEQAKILAMRKAAEERRKREREQERIRQAKREAFERSQRAKGLANYKGKWIEAEVAERLHKIDQQRKKVEQFVNEGTLRNIKVKVVQSQKSGALVSLYRTGETSGIINTNNVSFVSDASIHLVADGQVFNIKALYFCGTHTYQTVKGRFNTVYEYRQNKADAIEILYNKMYVNKGANDNERIGQNPSKQSPISTSVKSTGSGFFIGSNGHIVTNYHVIENANSIKILHQGKKITAEVVKASKVADLAILKTNVKTRGVKISDNDAELTEDIFAIGFPDPGTHGTDLKVTKGIISSLVALKDHTRYQFDAAIQPGNSGGALCNKDGEVVGVVAATINQSHTIRKGYVAQNVNYAIKSSELTALLRKAKVDYSIKEKPSLQHATKSSVMIMAY